jgi:hypothetical protein
VAGSRPLVYPSNRYEVSASCEENHVKFTQMPYRTLPWKPCTSCRTFARTTPHHTMMRACHSSACDTHSRHRSNSSGPRQCPRTSRSPRLTGRSQLRFASFPTREILDAVTDDNVQIRDHVHLAL